MLYEQPDAQNQQKQQEKLVLSAYPTPLAQLSVMNGNDDHTQRTVAVSTDKFPSYRVSSPVYVPPLTYDNPTSPSKSALRNDPAYKVLFVAITLIIVAGIVLASFATTIFAQVPTLFDQQHVALTGDGPESVTPQGTVDTLPSFPTPGGDQGSTTSSLPPVSATVVFGPTSTPSELTPTAQPTSGPNGPLSLQITACPQIVNNGATVPVSILTNEPGVRVQLFVTYDVLPGSYTSGPQMSDDGGNATLYWHVRVFSQLIGGMVQASVTAVAYDQNGQTAKSLVTLVQVTTS